MEISENTGNKLAVEHLEQFLEAFKIYDAKFEDLKKFLTVTQQNECLYVNRISVESSLVGLNQLLKVCNVVKVKEIPTSNNVAKDFIIHLTKTDGKTTEKARVQCRLIKEVDIRKTGESGTWGVKINSFKYIKA